MPSLLSQKQRISQSINEPQASISEPFVMAKSEANTEKFLKAKEATLLHDGIMDSALMLLVAAKKL